MTRAAKFGVLLAVSVLVPAIAAAAPAAQRAGPMVLTANSNVYGPGGALGSYGGSKYGSGRPIPGRPVPQLSVPESRSGTQPRSGADIAPSRSESGKQPYYYRYYDDTSRGGSGCHWMAERAIATNNENWWARYRACTEVGDD